MLAEDSSSHTSATGLRTIAAISVMSSRVVINSFQQYRQI